MKPKTGSHHFTDQLDYDYKEFSAIVTPKRINSEILRIAEVWGLAYYNWLINDKGKSVEKIVFDLSSLNLNEHSMESFRRRISYLNLENPFKLEIIKDIPIKLYSKDELVERPLDENIIKRFKQREPGGIPGRLEKDFQDFLNGESILREKDEEFSEYKLIYRRLALLGEDFYQLKKDYKVIREVPTGVFKGVKIRNNRILPTLFVDFIAFNNKSELSFIELKLNDPKLQVLSQLLDYALFAISYKIQIVEMVKNHIGLKYCPNNFEKKPISCYVANNRFHERFDEISKYYSPDKKGFNVKFKKVTLGESITI